MAIPPTSVNGTSTGFGQCSAANAIPAVTAAAHGFSNALSSRFVKNEFSPTCCSRQNAMYPNKCFGSVKCAGARFSIPRKIPITQIPSAAGKKNRPARFVATHKLSARHPSVFGVSLRNTALAPSHTTNTHHDAGTCTCNFQMYNPTYPTKQTASARVPICRGLCVTFSSLPFPDRRGAALRSFATRSHTTPRFPFLLPPSHREIRPSQNRGIPGS
jgi:hypothetical protein